MTESGLIEGAHAGAALAGAEAVSDPVALPGLVDPRSRPPSEVVSLRRQLQREQEARRLAERLAGQGIEAVLREQQELMLLGRVAVAANEAPSLSSAVDECLSLVARHAEWPAATMWIRRPDDPHLHPTGSWFSEVGVPCQALAEAVAARLTVPSGSLPSIVATSGAPQWFDGLQSRTNWLRDERDDALGVATALAVPVWAGRQIVGVVVLFHHDEVPRCNRLLELIEQVVTQLGVAVRRFNDADATLASFLGSTAVELSLPSTAVNGHDERLSSRDVGFLGEVAHQVRTPLHGIIGNLELLCASGLDHEQRDLGALALQSAIDLHQCLETWLEQVEQGRNTLGP